MGNTYFKYRNYAHFDKRISIQDGRKLAKDPNYVAKHGFYPFLHFTLLLNRYRRKKATSAERREPKSREIYYAAHIDRYIYQQYAYLLNKAYNAYCARHDLDDIALAYRTNKEGKCNIHFAKKAFDFLRNHSGVVVITGDFEHFFDNLNHAYLKQCLQTVLGVERLSDDWFAVYKNICCFSYVDIIQILKHNRSLCDNTLPVTRKQLNRREVVFSIQELRRNHRDWILPLKKDKKDYGIPQGSPISGVFANVYLIEFDQMLQQICRQVGGFYRRYSDDFIIILPNTPLSCVNDIKKHVFDITSKIAEKGRLILQPEKTKSFYFQDRNILDLLSNKTSKDDPGVHIDFLGFRFNGENVDLRQKTADRNNNKIMHKTRRIMKLRGHMRQDGTVIKLSFRPLIKNVGKNYVSCQDVQGRKIKRSTFNAYLKRSAKVFEGEPLLEGRYVNRKNRAVRLMTRVNCRSEEGAGSDRDHS